MQRFRRPAVALLLLVSLWPSLALAQALELPRAGVVVTLQGSATAKRPATPQPVALKFQDDVYLRDKIATGERSLVRLLLGGKAAVTIRELSELTITEVPGRSAINLTSGKVSLAIARERMRPGEVIEVQTPNAIAAVRGTALVVSTEPTAAGSATEVAVLRDPTGRGVDVTQIDPAGRIIAPPVTVTALHQFVAVGTAPGTLGVLTDVTRAVSGLQVSTPPHTQAVNEQQIVSDQQQALAALFAALSQQALAPLPPIPSPQTTPTQTITSTANVAFPPGGSGPNLVNSATPTTTTTTTVLDASSVIPGLPGISPPSGDTFMALILPAVSLPPGIVNGLVLGSQGSGPGVNPTLTNGNFGTGDFTGWQLMPPRGLSSGAATTPGTLLSTTLSQTFGVSSGVLLFPSFQYDIVVPQSEVDVAGHVHFPGTAPLATAQLEKTLLTLTPAMLNSLLFGCGAEGECDTGFQSCCNESSVKIPANSATISFTLIPQAGAPFFEVLLANVFVDPPVHLLSDGTRVVWTDPGPLLQLSGTIQNYDSLLAVCCNSSASLAGPLLKASDSTAAFRFSVLSLLQGGSLTTSSLDPLVSVERGTYALGSLVAALDISGVNTAPDAGTGLIVGTDQPLQHPGILLEASDATVTTQSVVRLDTALLEATRPLLAALAGSNVTSAGPAVDLVQQAKLVATLLPADALVMLNASTLTINSGALVNVAGGSVMNLTGNLVSLTGGSTLNIPAGPLLSVSGAFSLTGGSLATFGTGTNTITITNPAPLCPGCVLTAALPNLSGVPVLLKDGATPANVSVSSGFLPFKGLGATNTVNVKGPSGAVLVVNGPTSRVTLRP